MLGKKKEYFKVLIQEGGKYYSAVMGGWYRVQYQPNQWTKARKGKLFVFGSRRSANLFAKTFGSIILLCQVKGLSKPLGNRDKITSWLVQSKAYFWNKIMKNGSLPNTKGYWPQGTLWADEVKILPDNKRRK